MVVQEPAPKMPILSKAVVPARAQGYKVRQVRKYLPGTNAKQLCCLVQPATVPVKQ